MPFLLFLKLREEKNFCHTFLNESIWKWQNEKYSSAIKFLCFGEKKKRYSKVKVTQKLSDTKVDKKEKV